MGGRGVAARATEGAATEGAGAAARARPRAHTRQIRYRLAHGQENAVAPNAQRGGRANRRRRGAAPEGEARDSDPPA